VTPRGHKPDCACLACSPPSVRVRLLAYRRVTNAGCWEWTRGCDDFGYGQITVGNQTHTVHRMAYEEFVGPIPDGQLVLHHCDNPPCFCPEHLFLGTQLDNMRDRNTKRRDNNYWRNYLRWRKDGNWGVSGEVSLQRPSLRTPRGRIDPETQKWALQQAERKYAELVSGVPVEERAPTSPLTLWQGLG
jgi:hypothetical protein